MQTKGCIGIDGCKTGWVGVVRDSETSQASARIIDRIENLEINLYDCIAIDIPIGLPSQGSRECDLGARVILKPRGCCVFPAPIRPLLKAGNYAEACAIKMENDKKKISLQTWGILPKIAEVDEILQGNKELIDKFIEVHPEVSFCRLNDNRPLLNGKKSADGKKDRIKLVDGYFGPGTFKQLKNSLAACRGWADNDLLDACAALWTAERIIKSIALSTSAQLIYDDTGIPMRMMY